MLTTAPMSSPIVAHTISAPPDIPFKRLSSDGRPHRSRRTSYQSQTQSHGQGQHRDSSPDVIADLLASFPAISLPQDDISDIPANGFGSPPKSSRTSISAMHARSIGARTRPGSFEYRNTSLQQSSQDVDGVAQAPIVPTGRPDSAASRSKSYKSLDIPREQPPPPPQIYPALPSVHPALRHQPVELPASPDDELSPLPFNFGDATSSRPSSGMAVRRSVDGRPSMDSGSRSSRRESWAQSIRRGLRSNKGKDRDVSSARTSERTSVVNPVDEIGPLPTSFNRLASGRSPRSAHEDQAGYPFVSPASPSQHDPFSNSSGLRSMSMDGSDDEVRGSFDARMLIPDRVSSLRHLENRPKSRRKLAAGDRAKSPEHEAVAPAVPIERQQQPAVAELDAGDEVQKRIKQLKAAQEVRRQRDLASSPTPRSTTPEVIRMYKPSLIHKDTAVPPLPGSAPDTSRASLQLYRAAHVREHRLVNDDSPTSILRTVPISPAAKLDFHSAAATPTPHTRTYINFSLNKPTPLTSQQTTPRQSLQISRTDYASQRWAPVETPRRSISTQSPELTRDLSTRSQPTRPESHGSIDSIDESVREFLEAPRLSRMLYRPQERRNISYSEVGDPGGHVVFCCVGMGLTRYITAFYDELAASLKLRLITLDRPGVGDSDPYTDDSRTTLSWPDDIQALCERLDIYRFSLLAHSAGAIYALATALRMPHRISGRVHLLAPWIPPSQLASLKMGAPSSQHRGAAGAPATLPRSQRFLRILPTPFLRLSNSSFMHGGLRGAGPAVPGAGKNASTRSRKSLDVGSGTSSSSNYTSGGAALSTQATPRPSTVAPPTPFSRTAATSRGPSTDMDPACPAPPDIDVHVPSDHSMAGAVLVAGGATAPQIPLPPSPAKSHPNGPSSLLPPAERRARQRRYDAALTPALWELATRKANPAVDLLVCLERTRTIGFRYVDVAPPAGLLIHHGTKDARVPLENVRLLGRAMRGAEVRVLEGEGHGLMSSAGVMGGVLTEMSREAEAELAAAARRR